MGKKLELNEQYIIKAYLLGKSSKEIALELFCSNTTIFNILIKNNIKRRSSSELKSLRLDQDYVIEEYLLGKSICKISKNMGCSTTAIINCLRKNNVSIRSNRLVNLNSQYVIDLYLGGKDAYKIAQEVGCSSSTIYCVLEKHNIPRRSISEAKRFNFDEDYIIKSYQNNKKSCSDIGEELGCSSATIRNILIKNEVKRRTQSEAISGEKNPFYNKHLSDFGISRSGSNNGMYGKPTPHGKLVEYNGVKFRSTWEAAYAEYLDSKNVKWEYEKHTFPVVYEYEGIKKEATYTPDFYLIREDKFIEIKGYWRDDAKPKYEAFLEQYPSVNIDLFMKKELEELKVL